jgi:4-hydroxyphenylpyruvate dioxygenase
VYICFIRVIRVPKREVPNQKINHNEQEVKSVEYGLEKYLKAHKISPLGTRLCRIYVGNAKQSAHYYKTFSYQSLAYAGLETGVRDENIVCLETRRYRLHLLRH